MRSPTTIGLILFGIWLIITAIVRLLDASLAGLSLILNVLALAAGLFLLIGGGYGRGRRTVRDVGLMLLGVWLIVTALVSLLGLSAPGLGLVLAVLAIVAGLLLLFGWGGRRKTTSLGLLVVGLWLIIAGLLSLLGASFPGSDLILVLLGLIAGVLVLVRR